MLSDEHKQLHKNVLRRQSDPVGSTDLGWGAVGGQHVGQVVCVGEKGRITVRQNTQSGTQSYVLGSFAIEESVASLVERLVMETVGATPGTPPAFPYQTLEHVVNYARSGHVDPPEIIAGLGTLLLMTDGPHLHVRRILERYADLCSNGATSLDALYTVAVEEEPRIKRHAESLVQVIEEIVKMHESRGMSDRAAQLLAQQYQRALSHRTKDALFELAPWLQGHPPSQETLFAHFHRLYELFPPCDFIIDEPDPHGGSPKRTLVAFGKPLVDEAGFDRSQYLRSFQAEIEHMRFHEIRSEFLPTGLTQKKCPYFEVCTHPFKTTEAEVCEKHPWKHVNKLEDACWYSSGVAATLGLVTIRRKDPTDTTNDSDSPLNFLAI